MTEAENSTHPARSDDTSERPPIRVNPGFILGQLARSETTERDHPDDATRARATARAEAWRAVAQGLLTGALSIGSRTPIAGAPAWATPEVLYGGFVSGKLLATGDLEDHELAWLKRARSTATGTLERRTAVTRWLLGEDGMKELAGMLRTGCYRVRVPEEGALLVVVWLVERGHAASARALLDALGVHLGHFRFYPVPASRPLDVTAGLRVDDVGDVRRALARRWVQPAILRQREALKVWNPLYERVVDLFLETVEGHPPTLRRDASGGIVRRENGRSPAVDGGWPCQRYPDGWRERASAALSEFLALRSRHKLCRGPEGRRHGFVRLREHLARCIVDPRGLSGRDVGEIRALMAGVVAKRGAPGSERRRVIQAEESRRATSATSAEIAHIVAERLRESDPDEGLSSLEGFTGPVTDGEALSRGIRAGADVPARVNDALRRCVNAPLEDLLATGVIPSGEVLARVVPRLSAEVRARRVADAELRRLDTAVYRAFRRRRSVLLLDLAKQVQFRELPWVRALEPHCEARQDERADAREVLERLLSSAIAAFPETILPNKLLQEVSALAGAAALRLPIVEELAADIFMGQFSDKFLRSARMAAAMLEGTLYARYYALPTGRIRAIESPPATEKGVGPSMEFAAMCAARAWQSPGRGSSVAANGMVIEQAQILTTHNLAVLFDALGFASSLGPRLETLARRCLESVVENLDRRQPASRKAELRRRKNAAYAWRQMIFFLSSRPRAEQERFLEWATERLTKASSRFAARFATYLEALRESIAGATLGDPDSRRFLGWTTAHTA